MIGVRGEVLELENVGFCYEGRLEGEAEKVGEACGAAGVDGAHGKPDIPRFDDVEGVSLVVRPGTCTVLTGPSGSGKTTLARVVNGLAPAYWPGTLRGIVRIGGRDAAAIPLWERGRLVGSVFQDPASQFFSPDVAGEVAFACENYGLSAAEIMERTDGAIASFGLDVLRGRPLDGLSSGEKQRVAMASACAMGSGVVVCDEPTANLDEEGAALLAREIARLKREGYAVLVSEHRLAWLEGIADRYVYLEGGRVRWDRSAAEAAAIGDAERARLGLRLTSPVALPDLPAPDGKGIPALEAVGLACKRGSNVLWEGLGIRLWPGRTVALTGKNGAGKSTLARVLAGLARADAGCVLLGGEVQRASARRKRVWYGANDTAAQFFASSVADELLLGDVRNEALVERARALLAQLGLYAYRDAHPATLSGGQKQRLALACGLLSGREVLVFDEPTSGLDGGTMVLVADALRAAAAEGRAVLVITHDGEFARRCCDFRVRMEDIAA